MHTPARALLATLVLVLNATACRSDSASDAGGSSGQGGSGASGGAGGSAGGAGGSATGGSSQGGAGALGGSSGGPATGGTAGVGATAGTGGGAASGATGGSGGAGGRGGAGATGGSGGSGVDCDALLVESDSLLMAAQACSISDAGSVCTDVVDGLCCPAVVNNRFSAEARAYVANVKAIRDNCDFLCPAIPCDFPVSGECSVGDGGVGVCLPL